MPNLGLYSRKSDQPRGAITTHRCVSCRQELTFVRVHVSPPRLGPPSTTEFYECPSCDSSFAFDPLAGKWKFWTSED